MITDTRLSISIDNKIQPGCIALELNQAINNHHFFQVIFNWEDIEKAKNGLGDEAIKKIGKQISVNINNDAHHELIFKGIITSVNVKASGNSSQGQMVVFEGYSPTILLNNGKACQAYNDMDLNGIVTMAGSGNPVNILNFVIDPIFTSQIPYTVQYNESNFNFIDRLAHRYGEWFYYDGKSLIFGESKQPTTELIYGSTLINFNFSMMGAPPHTNYTAHSYLNNNTSNQNSSDLEPSANGEAKIVFENSASLWKEPKPNLLHPLDQLDYPNQLTITAQTDVNGVAANTIVLSGQSIHPSIYPGVLIKIKGGDGYLYGSYKVTSVYHQYSEGGKYSNSFTGTPSSLITSPNTNTAIFPTSGTQAGVVTDNNDPAGLGRVRVKLYWQRDTETPWLRIVMPYTGGDKGMYFVPEKDEEVMVSFEGGNAEKPFVIGSLYHGDAKPGGFANASNDIKAIKTRSGHTIKFDDANNGTSILIEDPAGNCIQFDTKGKNITITAPETMTINAKNLKINVGEKMITEVGTDMITTVSANHKLHITEKFELTAANAEEKIDGDKKVTAQGDLVINSATTDIIAKDGDILIKSAGVATMQGKSDAKVNKG